MNESQSNNAHPRMGVPWLLLSWLAVIVPLVWGVSQTLRKAMALFR